ncbi:MAG: hypothetical protein JXD19_09085 [Deltaproteobacteria bacterium]|nr:hypothetical protein [Deltaproteobacteria bacterium]
MEKSTKISEREKIEPAAGNVKVLMRALSSLPGKEALDRILGFGKPQEVVQSLSAEDLYWLVKKIGEDDSLTLLALASDDQWQFLIDVEIWRKDRVDGNHAARWLTRLNRADSKRLVEWLWKENEDLAAFYLFHNIEVIPKPSDESFDIPEGFFTLDGSFFIRVLHPEYQETIEAVFREMAFQDFKRYQDLLSTFAYVLPSQIEEEMYRLKNVRLAEHGFLPYEDALSIYAPLSSEKFLIEQPIDFKSLSASRLPVTVPVLPFSNTIAETTFTEALAQVKDPSLQEKMMLEFAGLCNKILSADTLVVDSPDVLVKTCRKAAGYINIALEKLCESDISLTGPLLRTHSLVSFFRVGYGLARKRRHEVARWCPGSWFHSQGLTFAFWDDPWGPTLTGIMKKKPLFYVREKEEYREFMRLSEVEDCRTVFRRITVLDRLLKRLTELHPIDYPVLHKPALTFQPLLFTWWTRQVLRIDPGFSSVTPEQGKEFFRRVRMPAKNPPYRMHGFKKAFINDLLAPAAEFDQESAAILKDTLAHLWQDFHTEYAWIALTDLDERFSKYITISET